jgi:hypothetical protein
LIADQQPLAPMNEGPYRLILVALRGWVCMEPFVNPGSQHSKQAAAKQECGRWLGDAALASSTGYKSEIGGVRETWVYEYLAG